MEIENSPLYGEVLKITNGGAKPVHYTWSGIVHPLNEGGNYQVLKILSVDIVNDYCDDFGEVIMVEVMIPGGIFAKRVYPNANNLEFTLTKTPLREQAAEHAADSAPQSERYRAVLVDTGDLMLSVDEMQSLSERELDNANILTIQFQLINILLDKFRLVQVGGIYRKCTMEQMIRTMLTLESQRYRVNANRDILGVDIVPFDNREAQEQIVIPHGTSVMTVPQYLQESSGGIYSAGLGYYLQNNWWYMYPCFDTTRRNSTNRTVTIINLPASRFRQIERTYRKDGDNLVILATGNIHSRDLTNIKELNDGTGIRFADASQFVESFVETGGNKAIAKRQEKNNEFYAVERSDEKKIAPVSPKRITRNRYVEYTRLARRAGALIGLVWENSDPSMIIPGLMVEILSHKEDDVVSMQGVVLKAHHYIEMDNKGITDTRYRSRTALSIFVKALTK